jgi:parallel beta-helix repeat protein
MNKKSKFRKSLILFLLLVLTTSIPLVSSQNSYLEYNETTNTCTVYPTGSDDTINLQEAFNLVTANGKGRVKLVEGEYTVNEEIVVTNFDGMFTGEGKRKTTLKTTSRDDWPHRGEPNFPEVASVFLFYQKDMDERTIIIADMTVTVHATTYDYGGFFGLNVFDIYGCVDDEFSEDETPLNTVLKRVRISGDTAPDFPFVNTVNPYQIGGQPHVDESNNWSFEPMAGTHSVYFCEFDTVGCGPKYNSVNGDIAVKFNIMKDTTVGAWLFLCSPIDVPQREIKYNIITGATWMGLGVWGSNHFDIKYNVVIHSETGIDMWGSEGNLVKGNHFNDNNLDLSWDQEGDNIWTDNYYKTKNWE